MEKTKIAFIKHTLRELYRFFRYRILYIILYPMLIVFGYNTILTNVQNNIGPISYSQTLKIVLFTITPFVMALELFKEHMAHRKRTTYYGDIQNIPTAKQEQLNQKQTMDDDTKNTRACHEAGHYIIAKRLKMPVIGVDIDIDGTTGGKTQVSFPDGLLAPHELLRIVKVLYGGYVAEKITNGFATTGSIGSNASDIERANELLKQYLILSDDELSLTGKDPLFDEKMANLSKKIESEVYKILNDQKDEFEKATKELIETGRIKIEN